MDRILILLNHFIADPYAKPFQEFLELVQEDTFVHAEIFLKE